MRYDPLVREHRLHRRLLRKADQAWSHSEYRLRQAQHRRHLPQTTPLGHRIVHDLEFDGVSVLSLDQLNLKSNAAFWKDAQAAAEELKSLTPESSPPLEYESDFDHCIPLNPSHVAKTYPALFMWGLDEDLLDIVENIIRLPLAYHGLCIRKEIVDRNQSGSRRWHCDAEDRNIVRVSVYLTDVLTKADGPFEYVPRSLTPMEHWTKSGEPMTDDEVRELVPEWQWKTCCGPAGTVLFKSAAKVLHHGSVPETERIVVSYYYTSRKPLWPKLCRTFSFESGISSLNVSLTPRQLDCLWEYRALLPAAVAS